MAETSNDGAKISLIGKKDVPQHVTFKITNTAGEVIRFTSYKHGYKQKRVQVSVSDQYQVGQGIPLTMHSSGDL